MRVICNTCTLNLIDPTLVPAVSAKFAALTAVLDTYRSATALGGWTDALRAEGLTVGRGITSVSTDQTQEFIFPTGRLLSRRWRYVAATSIFCFVGFMPGVSSPGGPSHQAI